MHEDEYPMNLQERYDAFVDDAFTEDSDALTEPSKLAILTDGKADWALRKIAEAERAIEARRAQYLEDVARLMKFTEAIQAELDALLAETTEGPQRFIDALTANLRRYAETLQEKGLLTERQRQYKFPHGSIGFHKKRVTYQRNREELLAWAQGKGLVRTHEEPDWEQIKERLGVVIEETPIGARYQVVDARTGELVAGVTVESPEHDEFLVKAHLRT